MKDLINKIHNADCLEFMKQLPDKSIDLVLTDPPYGMNYTRHIENKKFDNITNDDNLIWLGEYCETTKIISKNNAHIYIFCSWHNIDIFKSILQKYFHFKNLLIWDKNSQGMGDLRTDYGCGYEFICFCTNTKEKMKSLNGTRDNNIVKIPNCINDIHPTQKPIQLFEYLINKSSNENDLVLDCFSGSGTTAIACSELKRNFICIEKDKGYYEASCQRLENYNKQLKLF